MDALLVESDVRRLRQARQPLAPPASEMNGLPCLNGGGNVGTAAWVMTHAVLGQRRIGLVGIDFGYAPGTPYEQTQYYPELRELLGDRLRARRSSASRIRHAARRGSAIPPTTGSATSSSRWRATPTCETVQLHRGRHPLRGPASRIDAARRDSSKPGVGRPWLRCLFINPVIREEDDPRHVPYGDGAARGDRDARRPPGPGLRRTTRGAPRTRSSRRCCEADQLGRGRARRHHHRLPLDQAHRGDGAASWRRRRSIVAGGGFLTCDAARHHALPARRSTSASSARPSCSFPEILRRLDAGNRDWAAVDGLIWRDPAGRDSC